MSGLKRKLKEIEENEEQEVSDEEVKVKVQVFENGELTDKKESRALVGVFIDDEGHVAFKLGKFSSDEYLAACKIIEYETNKYLEKEQMGAAIESMGEMLFE